MTNPSSQKSPQRSLGDKTNVDSFKLYAVNASQFGVRYPETFVLFENRRGVRTEFCVDRSSLQLWISPLAGKSDDYRDRNWSNRDDHTAIFDRIRVPGLSLEAFQKCDFDPFHCVLHYGEQKLHLAQIYDQPAVLLWFEQGGKVDFKVLGTPEQRTKEAFVVRRDSRGRDFQFAAMLAPGVGSFQHQQTLDEARSVYARANLAPGQVLLIAGELCSEEPASVLRPYLQQPLAGLLADNERMVEAALHTGQFRLKGRPEMQELLERNRRIALSLQTFEGPMRTCSQFIYYLIWIRDAAVNSLYLSSTGWLEPLRQNLAATLANPSFSEIEPRGRFFGQMLAGPITKRQEDGVFYVIWQAFAYWMQSGDRTCCQGERLAVMQEAMDWLERYCFDAELGLFGRFYKSETPLSGSIDDGADNACGAPTEPSDVSWNGRQVTQSFDLYNIMFYNAWLFLAAMEAADGQAESAAKHREQADRLLERIEPFFEREDFMPSYGSLRLDDSSVVQDEPYGIAESSYRGALAIPWLQPHRPQQYYHIREQLLADVKYDPEGCLVKSILVSLAAMDTALHDEDPLMEMLEYLVPQSVRPGKYLPMPYTIPEVVDVEDGHPFRDVRPIIYSSAPWMAVVVGFGLRRLACGFAVRPTKFLDEIKAFSYRGKELAVKFCQCEPKADGHRLTINGEPLRRTWQIPLSALSKNQNELQLERVPEADENLLIDSTLLLENYREAPNGTTDYTVEAFGHNVVCFKHLSGRVAVEDAAGKPVECRRDDFRGLSWLHFAGVGRIQLRVD
ncbi:MAG: hypothetical protein ACFB21_01590 [Opitutales bacterium]